MPHVTGTSAKFKKEVLIGSTTYANDAHILGRTRK